MTAQPPQDRVLARGWAPPDPSARDISAGGALSRAARPRPGLRWGLIAAAVSFFLVWAILWGTFVHVRMDPVPSGRLAPGHGWTDQHGTTFTVLGAERRSTIDQGSSSSKAPFGASYVLVRMQVDHFSTESRCGFTLVGADREMWSDDSSKLPYPRETYLFCPAEDTERAEYWLSFLVPDDRIASAQGLMQYTTDFPHPPVLALPTVP